MKSKVTLQHGDCLKRLKTLRANSVDSLVTDPPYGLSREPDIAEVMQHWINGDTYEHGSAGFMGKTWDSFVPGPEYWGECFRVMKPGAYALVFAGTRTWDLMAISLRFAGFRKVDCVQWIYGSGFPKSHNISKAIDRQNGDKRQKKLVFSKRRSPGAKLKNDTDTTMFGFGGVRDISSAASADWDGYGTAMKPAWEPVLVFQKPIERGLTIAQNCRKWGCGALNIDASRIEGADHAALAKNWDRTQSTKQGIASTGLKAIDLRGRAPSGRWPANLLLSPEAAEELDRQSGTLKSGSIAPHHGGAITRGISGKMQSGTKLGSTFQGDSGGASRFFYVAKPSRRERNAGCEGMPKRERKDQSAWIRQCNVCGDRFTNVKTGKPKCGHDDMGFAPPSPAQNHHPTVKPITLMRYLTRMVTPPGGLVLDPFAGSGTTGCAARREGFRFIGIEREREYLKIARARIAAAGAVA